MNYHEMVENVEKKVIPEEITSVYTAIISLISKIKENYNLIRTSDFSSFNGYREFIKVNEKRRDVILQLESLRKIEEDLLKRERELEDKLIGGIQLSETDYKLLTTLKEKRNKISKNKDSILKSIHFSNNGINKSNDKRITSENVIELTKKDLKDNIELLNSYIEKLNFKNLGVDRLEGLSIEDRHINELNGLVENYANEKGLVVPSGIGNIFKNALEIRINMFKDIYKESEKIISSYKRHEDIDFNKITELESLFNTRVWDKPYSIYPYVDNDLKDMDDRHFNEYSNILAKLNMVTKGELSVDEIEELKLKIHKENFQTDMTHNYLSYKFADLTRYLSYVKERINNKEVKRTM